MSAECSLGGFGPPPPPPFAGAKNTPLPSRLDHAPPGAAAADASALLPPLLGVVSPRSTWGEWCAEFGEDGPWQLPPPPPPPAALLLFLLRNRWGVAAVDGDEESRTRLRTATARDPVRATPLSTHRSHATTRVATGTCGDRDGDETSLRGPDQGDAAKWGVVGVTDVVGDTAPPPLGRTTTPAPEPDKAPAPAADGGDPKGSNGGSRLWAR